jgi:hypothetical protein
VTKEEQLQALKDIAPDVVDYMVVSAVVSNPELEEINFVTHSIETSDGGKYELKLVHISGPKIQLKKSIESMVNKIEEPYNPMKGHGKGAASGSDK